MIRKAGYIRVRVDEDNLSYSEEGLSAIKQEAKKFLDSSLKVFEFLNNRIMAITFADGVENLPSIQEINSKLEQLEEMLSKHSDKYSNVLYTMSDAGEKEDSELKSTYEAVDGLYFTVLKLQGQLSDFINIFDK